MPQDMFQQKIYVPSTLLRLGWDGGLILSDTPKGQPEKQADSEISAIVFHLLIIEISLLLEIKSGRVVSSATEFNIALDIKI